MNLYNFHSKPKSLSHHDEAHDKVPKLIWDKYGNDPSELKKREGQIAKSAKYAFMYARDILDRKPFPAGEPAIARDAIYAYEYANVILNGPFPAGEPAIAKNARAAFFYATFVLQGPFYLDGKLIAKP